MCEGSDQVEDAARKKDEKRMKKEADVRMKKETLKTDTTLCKTL